MFERLKKVFSAPPPASLLKDIPVDPSGPVEPEGVVAWAEAKGFLFTYLGEGKGFTITGKTADRPWKLERGRSSRNYIRGEELRARAELKVNDDASVLIMNRALKEALEKIAYSMYTDTLQTTADPTLPEEMRWLAMYPEAFWDGVPQEFWERYSVLSDRKQHAESWLTPLMVELLMSWPDPGPDAQTPFMLMLLRGKGYLRMQYTPADLPTLLHATRIFTSACETAVSGLSTDISL